MRGDSRRSARQGCLVLSMLLTSLPTPVDSFISCGVGFWAHNAPLRHQPAALAVRAGHNAAAPARLGAPARRNRAPVGICGATMGLAEWRKTCHTESDEGLVGCMPFPLDDLLLPGEQKQLHLYEARFLSLFEDAIKEHGGCVGMLGFFEEGELAAVAVLCEILEWRRLDVGVHVRMRAASRVTVKGLTQIEPYIQVSACEFLDGERDKDDAVPASLTDEVYSLHAEIVDLTLRLDKAPPNVRADDSEVAWGHEKTDTTHCFRTSLQEQLAAHKKVLAEGRFLESDAAADSTEINSDAADTNYAADTTAVAHTGMERGADEGAQCMWKVANAHMEEAQLLSFVALAGLEPEVRLWGLDQASTKERLKRGLDVLRERKQILQAKMALCSLNFD